MQRSIGDGSTCAPFGLLQGDASSSRRPSTSAVRAAWAADPDSPARRRTTICSVADDCCEAAHPDILHALAEILETNIRSSTIMSRNNLIIDN